MNKHIESKLEYFTAQTAHEVTDECNSKKQYEELDDIYDKINVARFKGQYKITLSNRQIMDITKKFLIDKGFKVKYFYGCQRDPANDLIISW